MFSVAQFRLSDPIETLTTGATTQSRDLRDTASPQRVSLALTWSFRPPGQGPQIRQQPQQGGPPIPVSQ